MKSQHNLSLYKMRGKDARAHVRLVVNRQNIMEILLENGIGMIYYHTGGDKNDSFKNSHYNR